MTEMTKKVDHNRAADAPDGFVAVDLLEKVPPHACDCPVCFTTPAEVIYNSGELIIQKSLLSMWKG
jgi:hypothetical protein